MNDLMPREVVTCRMHGLRRDHLTQCHVPITVADVSMCVSKQVCERNYDCSVQLWSSALASEVDRLEMPRVHRAAQPVKTCLSSLCCLPSTKFGGAASSNIMNRYSFKHPIAGKHGVLLQH